VVPFLARTVEYLYHADASLILEYFERDCQSAGVCERAGWLKQVFVLLLRLRVFSIYLYRASSVDFIAS